MSEFFGFDGYAREPEGYFSWQHLLFVSSLMVIMILLNKWNILRQLLKIMISHAL